MQIVQHDFRLHSSSDVGQERVEHRDSKFAQHGTAVVVDVYRVGVPTGRPVRTASFKHVRSTGRLSGADVSTNAATCNCREGKTVASGLGGDYQG